MATASRAVWVALAALLALLAVAGASTLVLFDGNFNEGCVGNTQVLGCGACHFINQTMQGGYYFLYTGGKAIFYNSIDCAPFSQAEVLRDDTWYCNRFTYNSTFIRCKQSPGDIAAQ